MLTFRDMRKHCKVQGFHCHHVIPISVVERRSLARIFGRARSVGFEPEDFTSNGMHLPSTVKQAVIFRLPLHRGPHRRYNEIVAEQISRWSNLQPDELLGQLQCLQASLKLGLRRGPVTINGGAEIGTALSDEFRRIDYVIEKLYLLGTPGT
jgi:hypothetical protein